MNLATLHLLVRFAGLNYTLAAPIGIELSILSNFLGNRNWTWKDRQSGWHGFLSFHGVAFIGMVLQWTTLVATVEFLQVHYLLGSLFGVVGAGWNFLANHHFTFAHPSHPLRQRVARPALYLAALAIHLVVSALITHHWDTWVFQTSAHQLLTQSLTPYQVSEQAPDYIWAGLGEPSQAHWYAYPPLPLLLMGATYWPVAAGLTDAAWVGRVLIKLPFIIGALGLANLTYRLVATAPGPDAVNRARRVEKLLLFSPLIFLVTDAWGMFEALLVACLIGSVLALRNGRLALAGGMYGVATLIKIFPIFLGPVLLVYLVRRYGWSGAVRYFASGILAFALVSLPFFLTAPGGFFEQVFLMHGARHPVGFSPIGAIYGFTAYWARQVFGLQGLKGLIAGLSFLSFALTAIALILTTLASARRPATERNLLFFLAASMSFALFFGKVLNEQYYVLALGLLAAYCYHPDPDRPLAAAKLRRLILGLSVGMGFIALATNAHFMRFIPPDVATFLFGTDVMTVLDGMGGPFGLTGYQVEGALATAAYFLVAGTYWWGVPLARPTLGEGLRALHHFIPALPTLGRHGTRGPIMAVSLIALLMLPSVGIGVAVLARNTEPVALEPAAGSLAGVAYRIDWDNPGHDPVIRYGQWAWSTQVPEEGYYGMTTRRTYTDLVDLRAAGFDYVLGIHHPDQQAGSVSLGIAAAEVGLPFALLLDARSLLDDDEAETLGFHPDSVKALQSLLGAPVPRYWTSPGMLRLGPEGRLPVFLTGLEAVGPDFSEDERSYVAQWRWRLDTQTQNSRWDDAAEALYVAGAPRNATELAHADPTWTRAYARAEQAVWERAFAFMEPGQRFSLMLGGGPPPSLLQGLAPGADVILGPRIAHPKEVALAFSSSSAPEAAYAMLDDALGPERIVPILPAFNASLRLPGGAVHLPVHDGKLIYDERWTTVLSQSASHVLVYSWNDFDQSTALEPSLDFGTVLWDRTALWLAAFHSPSAPAPPPWDAAQAPLPLTPLGDFQVYPYPLDLLWERRLRQSVE